MISSNKKTGALAGFSWLRGQELNLVCEIMHSVILSFPKCRTMSCSGVTPEPWRIVSTDSAIKQSFLGITLKIYEKRSFCFAIFQALFE